MLYILKLGVYRCKVYRAFNFSSFSAIVELILRSCTIFRTQGQLVGLKTFVAGAFSADRADCPWDSEDAAVVHAAAELYFLNVAFTMVWRQNSREEVIHLFPKVQEILNWIENSGSPVGFFDTWTFVLPSASWTVKRFEIGNFRVVSVPGLLKCKAIDMKMTILLKHRFKSESFWNSETPYWLHQTQLNYLSSPLMGLFMDNDAKKFIWNMT